MWCLREDEAVDRLASNASSHASRKLGAGCRRLGWTISMYTATFLRLYMFHSLADDQHRRTRASTCHDVRMARGSTVCGKRRPAASSMRCAHACPRRSRIMDARRLARHVRLWDLPLLPQPSCQNRQMSCSMVHHKCHEAGVVNGAKEGRQPERPRPQTHPQS